MVNEIPGHSGVTPELKRSVFMGPGDNTAGAPCWHSVGPEGLSSELLVLLTLDKTASLLQGCFLNCKTRIILLLYLVGLLQKK